MWVFCFEMLCAQSKKIYTIGGSYLIGANINKTSDREFGPSNPTGAELYFHLHRDGSNSFGRRTHPPRRIGDRLIGATGNGRLIQFRQHWPRTDRRHADTATTVFGSQSFRITDQSKLARVIGRQPSPGDES